MSSPFIFARPMHRIHTACMDIYIFRSAPEQLDVYMHKFQTDTKKLYHIYVYPRAFTRMTSFSRAIRLCVKIAQ